MKKLFLMSISVLAVASVVGCDSPTPDRPHRDSSVRDGGGSDLPDEDGDGIPDQYEGRSDATDTDGDGVADYLDDDSDGDGVPDSAESLRPGFEPADSDGDGTYDFRDLDADGNGVPDMIEGGADTDGDGVPDSSDDDNDGDMVPDAGELGPNPATPADSDSDTMPDYVDRDSDGDTIGDRHESVNDTDRDTTPDRLDPDSDGDGISDAMEAGDTDVETPPRDVDGDLIPDFRDPDSDNDGLSDRDEVTAGTDPFDDDSDDDGVTDLVEVASGTDPLDPAANPRADGDFVFFEPYMMPAAPPMDTLDFATDIRQADVYFLMDTTASMGASVSSLRSSLAAFITDVRAEISDVWIGNGFFKDYPVAPFGVAGDVAYRNCQNLTGDGAAAVAGLNCYAVSGGYDIPESNTAALWATATGMRLPGNSGHPTGASCAAGFFGGPCFRSTAVPIVVLITDAAAHNGPGGANAYNDGSLGGHAPTYPEAITALTAANVRVIGIGQGTGGQAHLQSFARDTNAVDAAGAPLYSTTSGTVGATVLNQIRILASQTRFRISIEYQDDPADGVDSFAAFVDHIEARAAGDAARGCVALPAIDTNGDGHVDTFPEVTAGQRVCFDIFVKQNDTVMPTTSPQLFRATLRVLGDGFTELDSRDVFFLVPPTIEDPGGPD